MPRLEFRGSPAGRLGPTSRALLDSRRNVTSQLCEDAPIERSFRIVGRANQGRSNLARTTGAMGATHGI